jgi:hypothetical protein
MRHVLGTAYRTMTVPGSRRPLTTRERVWRTWLVGWVGATAIGIANALLRETLFSGLTELQAHQAATGSLLVLLTAYMLYLQQRAAIPSTRLALELGTAWAVLTIAFEFALGLLLIGQPLSELLHNYNVAAGRVWALVPLWMVVGPELLRRVRAQ